MAVAEGDSQSFGELKEAASFSWRSFTKKGIMRKGKLSKKTVEYNIEKLKKKGILKHIGPDKGGYWEVLEKP
ncbi:MAG: hypothetical protein LHV68_07855 [Elusimicrobia bacterium]|nr:hypothetical protein [Candidatus Liberimonas magnetica]